MWPSFIFIIEPGMKDSKNKIWSYKYNLHSISIKKFGRINEAPDMQNLNGDTQYFKTAKKTKHFLKYRKINSLILF